MYHIRRKCDWTIIFAILMIQVSMKAMERAPYREEKSSKLIYAAMFGQTNFLRDLLAGRNPDEIFHFIMAACIFYNTGSYNTALHLAVMNGREIFVDELLYGIRDATQMKTLIAMRNRRGFTALDCAAERGLTYMVRRLLSTSCCYVDDIQRALHVALENGRDDVASILDKYYQLYKPPVNKLKEKTE